MQDGERPCSSFPCQSLWAFLLQPSPGCQLFVLPGAEAGGPCPAPCVSPPTRLARPAAHTGAIFYSYFGSGARGKGRQGQTGSFFILLPDSDLTYLCPESTGGYRLPSDNASINSSIQGWKCLRGRGRFLVLLPFRSPRAWAAAPRAPITALVLLRKASPAIMFYSHFLRLWDGVRWGVTRPVPGHCTDFDRFLH